MRFLNRLAPVAIALLGLVVLPANSASADDAAAADNQTLRVVLVPAREARISAPMEGQLVALNYREGSRFSRGDILAQFDCSSREADYAIAEAGRKKADLRYQSQLELEKLSAVGSLEVQLAEADLAEAVATLSRAREAVKRCQVKAPYAGRMVTIDANQHEMLAAGTPLFHIVSAEKLRAELLVPSRWLVWLKQGVMLDIKLDELGITVPASVSMLGSKIDPMSQTVLIYATIEQDDSRLIPGMSGEAVFRRDANE
jgi:RND family efflux transporter MFP subunit